MEPLLKSDIFFVITSIAVVLCTIVFVVAGIYIIRTVKNMSDISDMLKASVKNTRSDIRDMSTHVRESMLFRFIFGKPKIEERKEEKPERKRKTK